MNAATEFDVGPLTWVKSEIDLALTRAGEALKQFTDSGDATQIKFCRTHLHQVRGALAIVGLDGVTQFTDALESLISDVEQGKLAGDKLKGGLPQRALEAVQHFLDDLIAGSPNQPLRLMPLYKELQSLRGQARISPTELFFPDLSLRPPKRRTQTSAMAKGELQAFLRTQRTRFQRGLLAWLRNPNDLAGVHQMVDVVHQVEATQEIPSARAFWWITGGMLTALAEGTLSPEVDVKQLCARVDLQIRRLMEGSKNVAERLMRDALYYVAQADSGNTLVQQVKHAYQLENVVPAAGGSVSGPQEIARRKLRDHIIATEEVWNKFCAGTAQSLPLFRDQAAALSQAIEQLGHTDFRRLGQAIASAANWLAEQPSRHSEGLAMEIATAILLTQNAQENFSRLGGDFAHQVDVMVARLHGFLANNPPEPGSEIPLLDEMSRQAQEKLLVGQVAREIQTNLAQIEQVLDGFFRDAEKRSELAGLDAPLRQIVGALMIMGQMEAVDTLKACEKEIQRFAQSDYAPHEPDFVQVADQLSELGFFIEAMQHGAADFGEFRRNMRAKNEPAEEEDEPAPTVEQEMVQARKDTQALLEAFKEQPTDTGLREELKQNLETLKQDADLVADSELGQQAKAALTALESGNASSPAIDEAIANLKPQTTDAPAPSAETLQLAQASEDELDAELLAIFIEEAKEVLQTITDSIDLLRGQPHNAEVLTTIRRSYHTLKGSGRMVGLRDLGEVSWEIEQVLNIWLRQELAVNDQIFDLIGQGRDVFTTWVAHLEDRSVPLPDPSAALALAASLKSRDESAAPAPAAPVPPPPAAAPAAPAAANEDDMYDGAAATLVLGPIEEEAPKTAEESFEALDIAPLDLEAPAPAPASTDYDAQKTVVLGFRKQEPVAPREPVVEFEVPPLDMGEAPAPAAEEASIEFPEPPPAEEEVIDFGELAEAGPAAASAPAIETAVEEAIELPPVATVEAIAVEAPAAPEVEEISFEVPAEPALEAELLTESAPVAAEMPEEPEEPIPGISPALYQIFLDEAKAHLVTLQQEFALLEVDPDLPTPHAMARAAHTLAGISGTVGIGAINRLGLALEHALLRRETAAQPGSYEALEIVRQTTAALEAMVASIAERRQPEDAPALEAALDELYSPPPPSLPADIKAVSGTFGMGEPEPRSAALPEPAAAPQAPAPAAPSGFVIETSSIKDELDEQLLPIFLEEATELNGAITENLRNWKANPADGETARALHRLFHTLKGSARMAGAMTLGEITHAIESRVEQALKAGAAPLELIEEIENAFDSVIQIVERLERGESLEAPAAVTAPAAEDQQQPAIEATEIISAAPIAATATIASAQQPAEATDEAAAQRAVLRVRADLIDQLVNDAGELSIARARIEGEMLSLKGSLLDLTENVIRLRRQLRDIEIQAESQMQSRVAHADEQHAGFDPLEFDRFTRFQELTRMMAESVNDVATVQQNLLKNLDEANAAILAQARMNRQLQQELMSVRMVPFASQAERLYRIVRQTAKELGKRANLEIRGGHVELDRSVLDKIGAPLEHLLRNAVAHGLEDRNTRVSAGKTEIGEVSLTLTQEGNEIIITMADDGAGLNYERIRARGIEAGLLEPGELADEGRLIKLIFTPGFSTADEVNQIAGRGIGMDVVKTEIGELGGRIEVHSTAGKGSSFRLYIPLTLAVTQALLVRASNHLYAVPSAMIEQVLELKEAFLAKIREAGEAEWLGNKYPFRFLPHLLGDLQALPEARRQYWVLLLRSGAQRIAVQVDELRGNQEVVIKNIGQQLARVIGIDGATVLGDGQVVLILNPVALASRARAAALPDLVSTTPQAVVETETQASTLPTVMVVDDSLTVRKITGRLLAREGYQVLTAKDGVDALEQMLDIIPDVLLVDIEMPRMDGFDLTRNVRADERLRHVPIVMITSRTADKHRNYAFEIGVNNYLGKPYQEEELLGLVSEYTKAKRVH